MKKYLYADESGNMDFRDHHQHPGATKYFSIGTLLIDGEENMQALRADLTALRYDIMRERPAFDGYFHASEDKQAVRDEVFKVLQMHQFKVDVTILEKSKAMPKVRPDDPTFYKYAWYFHLKNLAPRNFGPDDNIMLVNASYGTKKLRKNFRDVVEEVADQCCPHVVQRTLGFYNSQTDVLLQAADYVTWAVTRHFEKEDARSRLLIQDKIATAYDLFSIGQIHYYGPKAKPGSLSA